LALSRIMKWGLAVLLACATLTFARDRSADKTPGQAVDSGSLGVFMNGRRVATETFSIQQSVSGSVISSQFKTEEGTDKAAQSSELQLAPNGDLRKYEWKELFPGKTQATLAPSNEYLMEHISGAPDQKAPEDQPFLLPASTTVLDDYFFIHREVLVWRFMASACKQEKGEVQCPANQKTQFGSMNPHQRSSQPLSVEFAGREKVNFKGADRDMNKFVLHSEGGDWTLWLDDQFKLQRILVASDNTEVIRD
jgi:hypothetical protein